MREPITAVPKYITVRDLQPPQDNATDEGVYRGTAAAVGGKAQFTIVRRWLLPGGAHYFLVAWCIPWLTALIGSLYGCFAGEAHAGLMGLTMLAIVGGTSTYIALGLCLNRTTLTSDGEMLRITHGPLPWPRLHSCEVPIIRIERIFCREVPFHRGSNASRVLAQHTDRGEIPLLRGLLDKTQALFIVQELEARFGLGHAPD